MLTAAHCLFNRYRNKWIAASDIHFLAGYQRGEYIGQSSASRYITAEFHDVTKNSFRYRPREDWAVIELRDPIGAKAGYLDWALLDPAGLEDALQSGARLFLAGYPALRQHVLSVDMACEDSRLDEGDGLFLLRCASMRGDSGGPVLLLRNGRATLVSILSGDRLGAEGTVNVAVPVASFYREIIDALGGDRRLMDLHGLSGLAGKPPGG